MEKLIRRIIASKNDKSSLNCYTRCFISNNKSKELFKNSKVFSEIKSYISSKKVS